jgi:hypothetical protein
LGIEPCEPSPQRGERRIWSGGGSQLCDPATFAPLLEELFEGDPEFHAKDLLVYAMGAFGNLHLTDGSMRAISIDVNYRFFTVQPFEDGGQDADLDFYLARTLLLDFGDLPEWTNDEGNDMFPSAFAKLGQVAQGEIGLFFALAARGDNIAENLESCPLQNITLSSIS